MRKDWTFGRRIALGFSFSALILLIVSAVGYVAADSLIANDAQVKHTYEVRRNIARYDRLITDAESSQRGFTLTAREEYLKPFREAEEKLPGVLDELTRLVADNPTQSRRVSELRDNTADRLEQLSERIELTQRQGVEAALKISPWASGKRTMDAIRTLTAQMDSEEAQLMDARRESVETSTRLTKAALLGGCLLGLLAIFMIAKITVTSLIRQIGTAVQQVQSSSAELQAVANQQATSAKEQASAVNEIATTLTQLLASSQQIADGTVHVSQIASEAAAVAKDGETIVDASERSVAEISRQVEQIVENMLDLGKKSHQIGTVVDIVSELAEQTTILAINATIEAAGAGETGRRFAVVAEEIRKLAERVTGSTKEIRSLIDDVRSAVSTTVMSTESGSKTVEFGQQHFRGLSSALRQIVEVSQTTMDAAREIELSTKQQSSAVEQVNVAISSVHQATLETEASSGQTLQTASQLAALSHALRRIVISDEPRLGGQMGGQIEGDL